MLENFQRSITLYKIKICDRLAFNFPCDSRNEKLSAHLLTTECETIVLGSSLRDNIKKLLAEIELGRFTSLAQITVAVYSTKQTNLSLTLKASTLFQGQANIFSNRSILGVHVVGLNVYILVHFLAALSKPM